MTAPIMRKIAGEEGHWLFWCPGCECAHSIDKRWTFNGDVHKPTIRASILTKGGPRCHSFVTDGQIQFLNDCTHALAGQTVKMTPLPWDED
jgi:hypothetical protein